MERSKVEITFNNYQESDYSKTKRFKNLRKLFFVFAQTVYSVYVYIYIILRSRVFFVKEENFRGIKNKIYLNSYTNDAKYFDKTRVSNLTKSFDLDISSPYYYESFFKKGVTKYGLANYIIYDAFFKYCLERYYDDDFCISRFDFVEVNILDIENNSSFGDYVADVSNTMEIFVAIRNRSGDSRVKRILEDKLFVQYINEKLNSEVPFIHISGISILGD